MSRNSRAVNNIKMPFRLDKYHKILEGNESESDQNEAQRDSAEEQKAELVHSIEDENEGKKKFKDLKRGNRKFLGKSERVLPGFGFKKNSEQVLHKSEDSGANSPNDGQ